MADNLALPGAVRERRVFGSIRAFGAELWRDKAGLVALLLLAFFIFAAIFGPMLSPHSTTKPDLIHRLDPPAWSQGGSWSYPLGTDALGRDILTRLFYGARISLLIGAVVVLFAGTFGVAMGLIAGYKGGFWDTFIMRIVDVQIAFPGILLALLFLAVLGPTPFLVIVILSINGWMVYARVTRGIVLSLKEQQFVQAAETVGCSTFRIVRKYLIPNITSSLLTLGTLEFARIVLVEASLSYLGLGIQPPDASWGLMIAEGQQYITVAWWVITWPGVAIALTVLSLNLLSSWLRVISDPQQREKRFIAVIDLRRVK